MRDDLRGLRGACTLMAVVYLGPSVLFGALVVIGSLFDDAPQVFAVGPGSSGPIWLLLAASPWAVSGLTLCWARRKLASTRLTDAGTAMSAVRFTMAGFVLAIALTALVAAGVATTVLGGRPSLQDMQALLCPGAILLVAGSFGVLGFFECRKLLRKLAEAAAAPS